jgi:hypothetical protein
MKRPVTICGDLSRGALAEMGTEMINILLSRGVSKSLSWCGLSTGVSMIQTSLLFLASPYCLQELLYWAPRLDCANESNPVPLKGRL